MLADKKILVTGVTGTASRPLAEHLAGSNEVWGVARFNDPRDRMELEARGVRTIPLDLAAGDLSSLPRDFTHILHCAYVRLGSGCFQEAIQVNAVGAGLVLQHCRKAEAALVISSGSVYSPRNEDPCYPFKETDDIGRGFTPWAPASPISKLSLEAVARFCAEAFNLPTTIARLNMVYGPRGGLPVMDMDSVLRDEALDFWTDPYPANLIHSDDMCDQLEALFAAASMPATIVNWCGDDVVSRREWVERAATLAARPATIKLAEPPGVAHGSVLDSTFRKSLTGPCKVRFWDGFDAIWSSRCSKPMESNR